MLQTPNSEPNAGDPGEPRALQSRVARAPIDFEPGMRAGAKLAEARRQLGLSLQEIADRIRVRREFLEALEAMNIKLLPGKAYALAFLRSYARALGLDEKAIVEQFQDESALSREDAQKQIRNPSSKPRPHRPWVGAALVLAAAVGFVGWQALTKRDPAPAQTAEILAPPMLAGAASTPVSAHAEARVVEIRALAQGWLEARGPDGTVFLSRTLEPGDVYRPDPSPGWTLHARDGGAFEMFVNGTSAGLLGPVGQPVLGRPIDGIVPMAQAELPSPRS
jgi:cytoskeleton protein RodZ